MGTLFLDKVAVVVREAGAGGPLYVIPIEIVHTLVRLFDPVFQVLTFLQHGRQAPLTIAERLPLCIAALRLLPRTSKLRTGVTIGRTPVVVELRDCVRLGRVGRVGRRGADDEDRGRGERDQRAAPGGLGGLSLRTGGDRAVALLEAGVRGPGKLVKRND